MKRDIDDVPHNRTALTEAILSLRNAARERSCEAIAPIFSDPSETGAGDEPVIPHLAQDSRERVEIAARSSRREAERHTLRLLDEAERILRLFGNERQAERIALIRSDILDDRPSEESATISTS